MSDCASDCFVGRVPEVCRFRTVEGLFLETSSKNVGMVFEESTEIRSAKPFRASASWLNSVPPFFREGRLQFSVVSSRRILGLTADWERPRLLVAPVTPPLAEISSAALSASISNFSGIT